MNPDFNIRSRKELKRSLLKRAIQDNRGAEIILLIQWRLAASKHVCEDGLDQLFNFEAKNFRQPRAVRMLNLVAALEGNDKRYSDASVFVFPSPRMFF